MNSFLIAVVVAATPLLFATLGELLSEKVGNLNLGVEGMMLIGAVVGVQAALSTGSPVLAVLAAFLAGAAGAAIFAVLTISLRTNQVVTGLTLTIFGTGFSSFIGNPISGVSVSQTVSNFFNPVQIPLLSKIPLIGQMLFHQDVFVYLGYLCAIGMAFYLGRTRIGLNLRAIGENASAADASGINVTLYKYINVIIGGGLCGLGGAYLSVVVVQTWQENITAGKGWIAVALVIFASWKSWKAFLGAILFGALSIVGYRLQAMGILIPQGLLDMIPYAVTIIVVIISTHKNRKEDLPPEDLGNAYFREER